MIDIIDDMIDKAKQVKAFDGRVYRSYPQLLDGGDPYATVNPGGRTVLQTDYEGQEVAVLLSYNVWIFGTSPEDVDDRFNELTTIYNHAHITNTGYSPSYQTVNGMFTALATYSVTVDKRGMTYSR